MFPDCVVLGFWVCVVGWIGWVGCFGDFLRSGSWVVAVLFVVCALMRWWVRFGRLVVVWRLAAWVFVFGLSVATSGLS